MTIKLTVKFAANPFNNGPVIAV